MAENLRYTNNGSVGVTYNNSSSNYNTYGRLYSFYQVVNSNLAPVGWHIPTEAEVFALHNYVINTYNNQGYGPLKSTSTLWSPPNTVATNATGFTALPSGRYQNNVFSDLGFVFYMWSSSSYGAGKGYAMYFRYDGSGGAEGLDDNNYFAIRCLRN
jgi:uncharacterized protein (TIGR02145 family)